MSSLRYRLRDMDRAVGFQLPLLLLLAVIVLLAGVLFYRVRQGVDGDTLRETAAIAGMQAAISDQVTHRSARGPTDKTTDTDSSAAAGLLASDWLRLALAAGVALGAIATFLGATGLAQLLGGG